MNVPPHEPEQPELSGVTRPERRIAAAPAAASRGHHADAKAPVVRYLGFKTTHEGREYSLRATDELQTRLFVVLISHEHFASRGARFQDGPDLCFTKLEHELAAEPALAAGSRLVMTPRDLLAYRTRERTPASRKTSTRG